MLDAFERHPLTFGPSPLQPLRRLSEHLGGRVELWAKREDANSGLAFGGNKTRKLEWIVPDVLASGADVLVSIGGVQSNHTRQVAAVAAHLGLPCHLIQESWVPHPDPIYDRVGNLLLSRLMGAHLELVQADFDIGTRSSYERTLECLRAEGRRPYGIPAGASLHPLGGLGFVAFAEELRAQEAELGFTFDYVVVCSVTGSTQGGMVVGFLPDNRARRVIGIDASAEPERTHAQILHIARGTAERIGLGRDVGPEDVVLETAYGAPRYGLPSPDTLEAMRLAARLEAMPTDPVYEGKSMHGLLDLVRKGRFPPGSRVLYAHLGGVPALDGYAGYLRDG